MRNMMTRLTGTGAILVGCALVAAGSTGCGGFSVTIDPRDTVTCLEQDVFETQCYFQDVVETECYFEEVYEEQCIVFGSVEVCEEVFVGETEVCEDFIVGEVEVCEDVYVETIQVCG